MWTLSYDLGSPYAYLAVERAERVLGAPVALEPVLLGAIFRQRGSGSWARTPARADGIAELEARAARYGLPPMRWPEGWPGDGLAAMRAATWAARSGGGDAFALAAFRHAFARGEDITGVAALSAIADEVGLDGAALPAAIADPEIKARLRATTEAAWDAGVRGVPTLRAEGRLIYGDDRLEEAV
jgi:2-hydroxychromene-2-carboxylate isomerase